MDQLSADKPEPGMPTAPAAATHKTRGDKTFDRWLYGGLNGIGNFIITVPLGYWAARSNIVNGKHEPAKILQQVSDATSNIVGKKYAGAVTMMLATSLGGWALVGPTWLAEHFRKPIVDHLNEGKPQPEHPQVIPPQTIGSLLRGRMLAMATVTASFVTADWLFKEKFEQYKTVIAKGTQQFAEKHLPKFNKSKAYYYGEIGALDVFATAAAATLLYVGSRFFAKHRDETRTTTVIPHRPPVFHNPAPEALAASQDQPTTSITGEKQAQGPLEKQQAIAAQLA